ncbi:MAG TPA: tRNA pseudouridine(55) synthase TruB [Tepidisphaeraceae bacterium]|nr:tRNA pseudouridine(55) synthase TruB [Tepidisphaeraceae bacterium]
MNHKDDNPNKPPLEGVLVIDKPAGVNSTAVVGRIKRLLPRRTKVGHAGTLDRFATGVLLVMVGRATKLCEPLMNSGKAYEATIRLGATTDSLDPDTPERAVMGPTPTREKIERALPRFIGIIEQAPPTFSAVKIAGRRASDRIRAGESVAPQSRPVRVDAIDVLDYDWPTLRIAVRCGRGTYIRALARDLGKALGSAGYLVQLRRTRVGEFDQSMSIDPELLTPLNVEQHLRQVVP